MTLDPQSPLIGWGSYREFSGPYFWGDTPFVLGPNPTWRERITAVVTATEGNKYNAVNGYDRCKMSAGLIQECEAVGRLSQLLGAIYNQAPEALEPVLKLSAALGFAFTYLRTGENAITWGFMHKQSKTFVDAKQPRYNYNTLFFGGYTGQRGQWGTRDPKQEPFTPAAMQAKAWVAALGNALAHPGAQRAQRDRVTGRITEFFTEYAKKHLLEPQVLLTGEKQRIGQCAVAAYTSFAANLPANASKQLQFHIETTPHEAFTHPWLVGLLNRLTWGEGISIYPQRYNKIRPLLESFYGVDIPDIATELKALSEESTITGFSLADEALVTFDLSTPVGLQSALIFLGYDLGPKGADGKVGAKTMEAIKSFQTDNPPLTVDGIVGPKTKAALMQAVSVKQR